MNLQLRVCLPGPTSRRDLEEKGGEVAAGSPTLKLAGGPDNPGDSSPACGSSGEEGALSGDPGGVLHVSPSSLPRHRARGEAAGAGTMSLDNGRGRGCRQSKQGRLGTSGR